MVTEESFTKYIKSLGHEPACASICVKKILHFYKEEKQLEFDFFVNKHNLCWFIPIGWYSYKNKNISFTVQIREFKLHDILE